jgi:hypothetical protein
MSSQVFETTSIDLAAALVSKRHTVAIQPDLFDTKRATFRFQESTALHADIVDFERGGALPAKDLLHVRARLYRMASRAVNGGGGRNG